VSHHTARNLIIEVAGLVKAYQVGNEVVKALNGVDLNVYKGDLIAIMGPSGSGKSTLMHLLGCLDSPTSGTYFLDQEDVSKLCDKKLASIRSLKIGFVFQSFNLIPQLNVVENVEIPFTYQEHPPANTRILIKEALIKVGLGHRLNHHPSELSGGEVQRVAIARALVINPLLILADEPTGNLDSENGKAILNLFRELNEQDVTIIIVTHDPEVAKSAKRLVRMKDGKIVEDR
jgi:putative ABC transport system ATP-binding protein